MPKAEQLGGHLRVLHLLIAFSKRGISCSPSKASEPRSLSARTEWLELRNQLARNLEIAENLSSGRRYGALLIVEGKDDFKPAGSRFLADDLPHYTEAQRDFLVRHFIGSVTWADVCGATGLDFARLPETSADFYISFASRVASKPAQPETRKIQT